MTKTRRAFLVHRCLNMLAALSCSLSLCALNAAQPTIAPPTLVSLEGPPRAATLIGAAENGELRFQGDNGEFSLPTDRLIYWGAAVEPTAAQACFVDGGILVADVAALDEQRARFDSVVFGRLDVPLVQLAGIMLHPPTDPWQRDALRNRLVAASGEADQLLLDNRDVISGRLLASDGTTIALQGGVGAAAGNKVEIPLANVAAIVLNPALRSKGRSAGRRTWLGFADGSLVAASEWTLAEGRLALRRSDDTSWRQAAAAIAGYSSLEFVQPLDASERYLSDLKPESYRHVPFLDRVWDYRLDRTVSGARLRGGGQLFVKGVGMHSASRLTFPLDAPAGRLEAELAIDDETHGGGSVVFRVFADAEERYRSPIVRGGDPLLPISVDLTGAKRVSLVVDHAERGDQLDRADWLNVRLVP